ncbi:MAG: DUF6920 family protein [Tropicimonas sp.]|uniref:DUF6920 family protein n=1 Tax=Tropicimonas sp. TaxID=2067044 RepID=UPI003A87A79D
MIKVFLGLSILLVLVAAAGFWRAGRENARLIGGKVMGDAPHVTIDLRPEVYAGLPAPVRRYFDFAFNGRTEVSLRGFRWREDGDFLLPVGEFRARGGQTGRADTPVYAWTGTFHRFGLPVIESRDAYLGDRHDMRARLFGWVTAMQTDYDQPAQVASLHSYLTLRYYGQAPLMPWALLPNDHVVWEARDDTSAFLRVTRPNLQGAYIVRFGADGRIEEMATDRLLMEGNGIMQSETGLKLDYREQDGFMVPTRMDYLWTLEDGTVSSHYRFTVRDREFLH